MRSRSAEQYAERVVQRRSAAVFNFFVRVFRRAFSRDFHALRISRNGPAPDPATPRLIFFSNHPSWWDPVAFVLLSDRLFRGRACYAPIDARMLRQYGFLERIGAFGIALEGHEAGAAFLAVSRRVMRASQGMLLVTAQGRLADARERPVTLRPGLAHLARWIPDATFVPLALECVFWDERKPELLVRFGKPVAAATLAALPATRSVQVLSGALEETMDRLAAEAIARDPDAFETVHSGSVGVGGIYDVWRRARAHLRGERFSPAHGKQP